MINISNISKNGIISTNILVEEKQYNKSMSLYKTINPNLFTGKVELYTDKTRGTYLNKSVNISIPASVIQSLKGRTLYMSYEVSCNGARYSTEQGQTAYNYTRYGIHGGIKLDGTQNYPFASELNYSGPADRRVQTWTIPSNVTEFTELTFSIQNFDKPASTNNETWFIRNLKVEVDSLSPFVFSDEVVGNDGLSAKEFIEI